MTPAPLLPLPLLALLALSSPSPSLAPPSADDRIGDVRYERLATREATYEAMLERLVPRRATWGDWWHLGPFPYAGHGTGDLATPRAPEAELERMAPSGPGPDLGVVYEGKKGVEARWRPLGRAADRRIDLHLYEDPELNDEAVAYLYTTVEASAPVAVDVTLGSDDGVRLWLNGELVHENDVPRGLDPFADALTLPLARGINHVLVKVSEGAGDWAFQVVTRRELDPVEDVLLHHYLDRDFPPSRERAHWTVSTYPVPRDLVLEVGGLDVLSDGRPVVCTRRGDVLVVEDAWDDPPVEARFRAFATGLHEPLGLAVRSEDGRDAVYCVQRGELTRLVDEDGDGRADLYETVADGWGVSGNYHEFAFGPAFDDAGSAWVTLNVGFCGGLGKATVPWRGWAVRVTPEGAVEPVCDGLRSPNGLAHVGGAAFYVDNQGDYVATNKLAHLEPGSWHGHPASLRWRDDLASPDERPPRKDPAVWFPYKRMGQSAADVAVDDTGGAFGPFAGQVFVGDQTLASVMRVTLEEVEGAWQGACYPFLGGLDCGVNRLAFAPDGSLLVGQTDRGWASVGRRRYGLQRIAYTGVPPFEVLEARAAEDGFELAFTKDLDPAAAVDPGSWRAASWTYAYHAAYGAPEDDVAALDVVAATLVDPRTVRLVVEPLRAGYVHHLAAPGVRSAGGEELLHEDLYYTLNRVPGRPVRARGDLPRVTFLTHSAGYEHAVVKRPREGVYAHAEERLVEAARGRFDVVPTKDVEAVTAARLAETDAVVLYTTGDLAVPPDDLLAWVRAGGALVGAHCATDTWPSHPAFLRALGGAFDGHPWTQEVGVDVVDARHPAVDHLERSFRVDDEIYQHRDLQHVANRVLLALDGATVDLSKGAHDAYPLAWWRDFGEGRILYTALGHRPELWRDAWFLEHVLDGIGWALDGPDLPAPPPPGARVLWGPTTSGEGSGAAWTHRGGGDFAWERDGDELVVAPGAGDLVSRDAFGDHRVHVEFRLPEGGNSGVYLHGRYEVQVYDTHGEEELRPGSVGGVYAQHAPAVRASRPAGAWQSLDLVLRAPRLGADGAVAEPARLTAWLNGVRVHDDVELAGPTPGGLGDDVVAEGPLLLQDHGDRVRFRNVWVVAE